MKTPVSMDNSLFSPDLSTKTPVFMDNVPILSDSSMKTPVSMDNPLFSLYLSTKTPLFMDNRTCFLFPSIKSLFPWTMSQF